MLSRLVEKLPIIVFRINHHGVFTYVNDFIGHYGYTREDLIGKPIHDFINPDDLHTLLEVLSSRENGDFSLKKNQYRFFDARGVYLDLEVRSLVIVEQADGSFTIVNEPGEDPSQVYSTLGLAWDVTSRVRAHQILSAILNSNPSGMIIYNEHGTILRTNEVVRNLLGYERDDNFVGLPILDFIHPDDRQAIFQRQQALVSGIEEEPVVVRVKRFDGSFTHIESHPVPLVLDDENYVLVSFVDVEEKRRKEQELREKEERYRAIYDNSNDAIFLLNKEGLIDCNQRALEMFECSRDEILGTSTLDFSPDFQPHMNMTSREAAGKILEQAKIGNHQYFEWIHQTQTGKLFNAEININNVEIQGEKLLLAIVRDISRRKSAESKFKTFFEKSPVSVMITDFEGKIKTVNPMSCEFFGYSEEELVGNNVSILQVDDYSNELESKIVEGVMSGEMNSGTIKKPYRTKNGDTITGNLRLNRILMDNEFYLMATIEDVSQLEEAYGALTYKSQLETFLGEVASQFIALPISEFEKVTQQALKEITELTKVDLSYIVTLEDNETFYSVLNYWTSTKMEHFKIGDYKHLPIKNVEQWVRELKKDHFVAVPEFEKLGSQFENEKERMRHLGIVSAIDIPMIYENEMIGYIGFSSVSRREWDEDEVSLLRFASSVFTAAIMRARIQEQKEHLTNQLFQAQKMEEVGRLTGGIAHDFNNLLTVILGQIDLLKLYSETSDKSSDLAKKIELALHDMQHSAENAVNLTKQLLVFSRSGILEQKIFNPNIAIKEIQKLISRITPSNVEKKYHISDDEVYIKMDPTHLQQIFLNLAINAVDAMPNGGTLNISSDIISISEEKIDCRICNTRLEGDFIRYTVEDEGFGIPSDSLDKIFEPFYTTKEAGKGTGLGLATVANILKNVGGHLFVNSIIDKGTIFSIYLPIVEKDEVEIPSNEPVKTSELSGEGLIVVVEDNPNVQKMLKEIISSVGFEVKTFDSANDALANCDNPECKPKLLISDYMMPGINGLDFVQEVKTINPDLPILLMSGYIGTMNFQEKLDELKIPFLSKPFKRADLLGRIFDILG